MIALALAQRLHPVVLFGDIDQIEIQRESRGDTARRVGRSVATSAARRLRGLRITRSARFRQGANSSPRSQTAAAILPC